MKNTVVSTAAKFVGAWVCLISISMQGFTQNTAGIVVQNSTGEIITRCVEFSEAEITVDELLVRSGFKVVIADTDFGKALCFLHDDGVGDANNCFGHPLGWFWEFFQHNGVEWESSMAGIGDATVSDGSLVGFDFGAFGENGLPPMTYDDVCGFTSTAGIVIDHSDGERKVVTVDFPGETITGTQLLQKSGLEVTISDTSFGPALCSLDGEGQPESDCFGDPLGRFWGFNILTPNDEWTFSEVGIGDAILRDSDVAGFFFSTFGTEQPPISRFEVLGQTSNVELFEMYQ